ncbi:hypothetical protein JQ625_28270 [Bradyrhizobium diazoefficiens]|nr:hypothetical protein [Bradyrhizobium diazoefficiens]MBR0778741.1 hypothetical protein [Bradyrhizobium diazoefficiens]
MTPAPSDASITNAVLLTVFTTLSLGLIGFIAKYLNDLAIARRRDRLDRVNTQLRLLYGPLFALTKASAENWKSFYGRYRTDGPFFPKDGPQPTELELEAWRLWMSKVFMPLNRRMMDVIISNADLLEGEMPIEFTDLVEHVSAYEVVLARWKLKDFSEHISTHNYPDRIAARVKDDYDKLRSYQHELLKKNRS